MKIRLLKNLICAALGSVAWVSAVCAQGNLVQNGDFDTYLLGWTVGSANDAIWISTEDYEGNRQSGAALIGTPALFPTSLMQCIELNGDGLYLVNAWAKSTCGNDATLLLYLADDQCKVIPPGIGESSSSSGAWKPVGFATNVPAGVSHVVVALENNGTCHDNVYFDHVALFTDVIFSDSFDSTTKSQ